MEFLVKLGLVSVAILVLYYIMSPYQNCVRLQEQEGYSTRGCIGKSAW